MQEVQQLEASSSPQLASPDKTDVGQHTLAAGLLASQANGTTRRPKCRSWRKNTDHTTPYALGHWLSESGVADGLRWPFLSSSSLPNSCIWRLAVWFVATRRPTATHHLRNAAYNIDAFQSGNTNGQPQVTLRRLPWRRGHRNKSQPTAANLHGAVCICIYICIRRISLLLAIGCHLAISPAFSLAGCYPNPRVDGLLATRRNGARREKLEHDYYCALAFGVQEEL
ncbi:hypothetical protein V2G26_011487 [Clonostachys chloroleuca]